MTLVLSLYMIAALFMSFAWIGHLKFTMTLWQSIVWSMLFVLVEYILFNYGARMAHKNEWLTPMQTGFISLSMGALCLFIVSSMFLNEPVTVHKITGVVVVMVGLFFMHK
jgi:uncharacterized protein (DUF486 family)